jgi:hypothetical protein
MTAEFKIIAVDRLILMMKDRDRHKEPAPRFVAERFVRGGEETITFDVHTSAHLYVPFS